MTGLQIPANRQPVTEVTAGGTTTFTRPWFIFFQAVFDRIGGSNGGSTSDIEESLDVGGMDADAEAALYALTDELRKLPTVVQLTPDVVPAPEFTGFREEIAELRKMINDLQQSTTL